MILSLFFFSFPGTHSSEPNRALNEAVDGCVSTCLSISCFVPQTRPYTNYLLAAPNKLFSFSTLLFPKNPNFIFWFFVLQALTMAASNFLTLRSSLTKPSSRPFFFNPIKVSSFFSFSFYSSFSAFFLLNFCSSLLYNYSLSVIFLPCEFCNTHLCRKIFLGKANPMSGVFTFSLLSLMITTFC